MPTFNQADYIGASIQSVLNQTYKNIELIIIDNFSTDATEDVVKTFVDERINYLKFDNKGVIAAGRNYGVEHATGEILAFLDSDDLWLPDKVEIQLPHLLEKNLCLVSTSFDPIGDVEINRHQLTHILSGEWLDYTFNQVLEQSPIMTSSVMVKKSVFDDAHGFDDSQDYRFIEDWELWLRLSQHGKVRVLGTRLLLYRLFAKKERDFRGVANRVLKVVQSYAHNPAVTPENIEVALGYSYTAMGKACLDMNDKKCITYFKEVMNLDIKYHQKIIAGIGCILFYLPKGLRLMLMRLMYKMQSSFG